MNSLRCARLRLAANRSILPAAVLLLAILIAPRAGVGQTLEWARQGGASNFQGVAAGSSGAFVVGSSYGASPFVRMYDFAGNIVWTTTLGAADMPSAIALGSSGIYVAGTRDTTPGRGDPTAYDVFVDKFDANGNLVWDRRFGSQTLDEGRAVAVDPSGVYVAGFAYGTIPGESTSGQEDAFVRKYDADGNVLWTRQFGTSSPDFGNAVASDTSGVYVAGTTTGTFPGQQATNGVSSTFIRKYDGAGTELWTREFEGGSAQAGGIAADSTGLYVAGTTFLRKYTPDGAELWTNELGIPSDDQGVFVASNGNSVFMATSTCCDQTVDGQQSIGDWDLVVRKYDLSGAVQWTRELGSASGDTAQAIAADSNETYVSGWTNGFLPGQVSDGGSDAFVIKLNAMPYLCNPTLLTPDQASVPATGGTISVGVQAPFGCNWSIDTNGSDWIAPGTPSTGNGAGTASLQIAATDSPIPRSSLVMVAGRPFTVNQDGTGCNFAIMPTSRQHGSGAETGLISVNAVDGCEWGVNLQASWIRFVSTPVHGFGSGSFSYQIDANPTSSSRSGTIAVVLEADPNQPQEFDFTVMQAGAPCVYKLGGTSVSLGPGASSGQVSVTAPGGCPWTAVSNAPFISVTSGGSGSGNGLVSYSVAANPDPTPRTGTIRIAGLDYTINQAGITCAYSLSPTSRTVTPVATTGQLTVSAQSTCPWTAASSATDWLSITSGASGIGNGTVNYAAAANSTLSQRVGTITVAGVVFTLTQSRVLPLISAGGMVSNASYAVGAQGPAPVAQGSILAIFGTGLNNGSVISSTSLGTDGKVVATLGGASVRINNTAAPIFYSTPGQLGVQVPYGISGAVQVTVTVDGAVSAASTLTVANVAPGIFTINQAGTGIVAALHQDGVTLVTAQNPAHPNEVVSLFATGLGSLNPSVATGALALNNPTLLTVTAAVDGNQATVLFAGGAPGSAGLDQVNVRIPVGTRTAPDIPVQITVGGLVSPQVSIPVGP